MVQMRRDDVQIESHAQFEKRMQQRNRISPAGKRNEDSRATCDRSALKRRRNRIGHAIWRSARHQKRLFRAIERINGS
jgi:hypothetical protein